MPMILTNYQAKQIDDIAFDGAANQIEYYPMLVDALRLTMRQLADVDCARTEEYQQAARIMRAIGEST